ncbi:uncharacterized protein LOC133819701 [Humulus lupulus]|uniref:uncharacterized protein LOC133819701 n=1 Tax=Humulus lupulus TaxID=3486 RepID=UPI002B408599|nr:uncharacterized protein LOC133819701 [Humulus lupulus]
MIVLKTQVMQHVYFLMKTCLRSLLMLWSARSCAIHLWMMLLGLAGLFLFMVTFVSCKRKYISQATLGSCLESNYKGSQIVLCTCAFLGTSSRMRPNEPFLHVAEYHQHFSLIIVNPVPVCCFLVLR